MGEDDQQFIEIANQYATLLSERGLRSDHSILDIGCGYGKLAFGLMSQLDFRGQYEGFDLLRRHVDWCNDAITTRASNFHFTHLDIANARYNPEGSLDPSQLRFPYDDDSFDFCALFSVFTHMYDSDIRRYVDEIKRVVKSTGVCVATLFLFNETRMAMVTSEACALPMKYQLSEVCRYFNKDSILHAISYEENYMRHLWTRAGFVVTDLTWGSWAGDQPASHDAQTYSYQDVMTVQA